jgi:hypothetical protein
MKRIEGEFGPFQISARLGGGDLVALELAEVARVEWASAEPVRTPVYYPDQKRHPGWFASAKAGRLLPFESRLEFAHLLLADLRQDVVGMLTQPFRLHWRDGDARRSHVPDVLLMLDDGGFELLNVTRDARTAARADIARRLEAARVACQRLGWRSRTLVGPPPRIELQNARLLASCRRPPLGTTELREGLLAAAARSTSIAALELTGDAVALSRPVILHLLATGELLGDLARPLTLQTQVRRAQRDRWPRSL